MVDSRLEAVVGSAKMVELVSDLKMEKFTVLSDVWSQTETNQKQ